MSNTIQTAPNPPVAAVPAPPVSMKTPPTPKTRPASWYVLRALKGLASLRLTVVLFSLSLLLVFFGTLAQIDAGIWSVVNNYFRWFWVWVPFQLFIQFGQVFFGFPKTLVVPGAFPFPGGLTLGILLLANLLSAHAVRFKLSWKRTGILLIHSGLILMLMGEFIAYFAVEGRMTIEEGETANVVVDHRHAELAIASPDPDSKANDHITVIPDHMLKKGGAAVHHDELPFDVEVVRWMVNAQVRNPKDNEHNPANAGFGVAQVAEDIGEVSGVSTKQVADLPACYVTLKKKDGTELGTYLFSIWLDSQPVVVDGKTYNVALQFKHYYKPYSLKLLEFRFDRYIGTNTPKNFSSRVRLHDPEQGEDREVVIRMNEPLRHRGETFYQSSWNEKTERGTVLQVVRNPGWLLPYFSCIIVALGMIVHFGLNLSTFMQRRRVGT